uniref:hypothetical protein n=1 Tax=uncultured Dysgonomonas sp. TaxID=206096 RepID=UPI002606C732|nr:hypothetical protein [uncultured Dysgonomonas sp.]
MKTKFLLMTVSCIALLSLTSCEKDEMGDGGLGGGGKEDANTISKSLTKPTLNDNQTTLVSDPLLKVDE